MSNLREKWESLNKEYQTLIHRKEFGYGLKKRKEKLEGELAKLEGYLKRLGKQVIFIDTHDVNEKPISKKAEFYRSSIKL